MAESRFDRLEEHIKREYIKKGYSEEDATRIAKDTAADVGREKYGVKGMETLSEEGKEKEEGKAE